MLSTIYWLKAAEDKWTGHSIALTDFYDLPLDKVIKSFELRHDKTNKMSVRPAKTQISLGIRPVWSES